MRRVTYKSVLQAASVRLSGDIDPSTLDADTLELFINRWARFAWEKFFWPELTLIEKRQFRDDWAIGSTYGAPSATAAVEVYYPKAKKYYQSLRGSNTGNAPATGSALTENSAYWAEAKSAYSGDDWAASTAYTVGKIVLYLDDQRYYQCHTAHTSGETFDSTKFGILTPFQRSIDYEQTGKTALGAVRYMWDSDPRVHDDTDPIPFDLRDSAVIVSGTATVVWVEFRKRFLEYVGAVYSASTAYASGVTIYYTDGDYWRTTASTSAGQSPDSTPAKWERLDFPYIIKECVAQGAYADVLGKTEGKHELWLQENADAISLLTEEVLKVERQQSQAGQLAVRTR